MSFFVLKVCCGSWPASESTLLPPCLFIWHASLCFRWYFCWTRGTHWEGRFWIESKATAFHQRVNSCHQSLTQPKQTRSSSSSPLSLAVACHSRLLTRGLIKKGLFRYVSFVEVVSFDCVMHFAVREVCLRPTNGLDARVPTVMALISSCRPSFYALFGLCFVELGFSATFLTQKAAVHWPHESYHQLRSQLLQRGEPHGAVLTFWGHPQVSFSCQVPRPHDVFFFLFVCLLGFFFFFLPVLGLFV